MAKKLNLKYKPHPKQELFHQRCTENRFVLFLAGIGAGKTLAGVHESLFSALRNPGQDGAIVAPTFSMLRDVIMPQWREFVPKQLYEEKKKEQQLVLWTGQTIYLRSAERPDVARGLNLGWCWLDEPAMMRSEEMDLIISGRVGRTLNVPRPVTFYTTTPRGWNWLAQKFLREQREGHKIIRARSSDNPFFSPGLLADLKDKYTDEQFRQEVLAEVLETSGLAWSIDHKIHSSFDRSELFRSKKVVEVVGGVDWGWGQPTALVVAARTKDNRWFFLEEWYNVPKNAEQVYGAMTDLKRRWNVKRWWADSAEPERIVGACSLGLRVLPTKKAAGSVNKGVQEIVSMLAVKHDGQPSMYVHHSMKRFINEAAYYHYEEGKENPIGDRGDHACDAARYLVYQESISRGIRGYIG